MDFDKKIFWNISIGNLIAIAILIALVILGALSGSSDTSEPQPWCSGIYCD
jgi:hypothetical protein